MILSWMFMFKGQKEKKKGDFWKWVIKNGHRWRGGVPIVSGAIKDGIIIIIQSVWNWYWINIQLVLDVYLIEYLCSIKRQEEKKMIWGNLLLKTPIDGAEVYPLILGLLKVGWWLLWNWYEIDMKLIWNWISDWNIYSWESRKEGERWFRGMSCWRRP